MILFLSFGEEYFLPLVVLLIKRVRFERLTTYLPAIFQPSCVSVGNQPTGIAIKTTFSSQPIAMHDS
jgi:hypothetical protein